MSEEKESSVVASLNKLSEIEQGSGGGAAKVKGSRGKVKEQNWVSNDNANSLLAGLLGEAEAEAEAEFRRKEEDRMRKEAEAEAAKLAEEDRKRREAEAKLQAEANRQFEEGQRRTQMLKAIERQKKIEAGEIDLEEEARRKAEEEERKRREAAEKAAKEAALRNAQQMINQQQEKLKELSNRPIEPLMQPKSNTGIIVAVVVLLLAVGGGAAFFLLQPEELPETPDPYAIEDSYPSAPVAISKAEGTMGEVGLTVVSQSSSDTVKTISGGSSGKGTSSRKKRKKKKKKKKSEFDQDLNSKGGNVLGGGKGGKIVF